VNSAEKNLTLTVMTIMSTNWKNKNAWGKEKTMTFRKSLTNFVKKG
jgi:hypothetical protein